MEQKEETPKILRKKMTRRGFLKKTARLAAGATAAAVLRGSVPEQKEALKEIHYNLVMIDFAPEKPVKGINQQAYPDNTELMKSILGKDYIPSHRLVAEFGSNFLRREKLRERVFEKYPRFAVVYGVMDFFKDHGQAVVVAMSKTWKRHGFYAEPQIVPLQDMISTSNVEFTKDDLDNYGFFINVEPEPIIKLLSNYPQQKVVNFSFQMGRVGFFYTQRREEYDEEAYLKSQTPRLWGSTGVDQSGKERFYLHDRKTGTTAEVSKKEYEKWLNPEIPMVIKDVDPPETDVRGAYTQEGAFKNLPKLFEICDAFPDKLFVAACGNYNDDVREAREELVESWPANLLLIAEWNEKLKRPEKDVYGADIYVDNKALGLGRGSSFSTPVIGSLASILINQGLNIEEAKHKLLSFCDPVIFNEYGLTDTKDQKAKRVKVTLLNPVKIDLTK